MQPTKKIYLLIQGSGIDARTIAAYSDKARAQAVAARINLLTDDRPGCLYATHVRTRKLR